eukprot:TRINITY_DN4877_c0_g1_i4.p1 TRINITY_DN4877_c0_g1~~TRINITY_DN4877_c0_g1_i4.p1  ORF type:complete len:680 (+),score=131.81 TRINITY_DN4877_c0_g1_i4:587-2626(+)
MTSAGDLAFNTSNLSNPGSNEVASVISGVSNTPVKSPDTSLIVQDAEIRRTAHTEGELNTRIDSIVNNMTSGEQQAEARLPKSEGHNRGSSLDIGNEIALSNMLDQCVNGMGASEHDKAGVAFNANTENVLAFDDLVGMSANGGLGIDSLDASTNLGTETRLVSLPGQKANGYCIGEVLPMHSLSMNSLPMIAQGSQMAQSGPSDASQAFCGQPQSLLDANSGLFEEMGMEDHMNKNSQSQQYMRMQAMAPLNVDENYNRLPNASTQMVKMGVNGHDCFGDGTMMPGAGTHDRDDGDVDHGPLIGSQIGSQSNGDNTLLYQFNDSMKGNDEGGQPGREDSLQSMLLNQGNTSSLLAEWQLDNILDSSLGAGAHQQLFTGEMADDVRGNSGGVGTSAWGDVAAQRDDSQGNDARRLDNNGENGPLAAICQQGEMPQIQDSEEDIMNRLKARIVSHPLYDQLLDAHVSCLKVATPLDQLPLLEVQLERADLVAGKYLNFLGSEGVDGVPADEEGRSELDRFMAQFVVLLRSFKVQLEDHVKVHAREAVVACWELEQSLVSITGMEPGPGSGATMSDDEDTDGGDDDSTTYGGRDFGGPSGPYGPLVPTDNERSIMERMKEELKMELKNGYRDKICDVRDEIMRKRRAGKLPGDTTAILKTWWNAHSKWPYPTEEEKANLVH